ncbi:MAG: ABC transporter permease [Lachnospiraceae bacterium]|nr:ABC transporter permease [Lachnospiraceae bacterium]
MKRKRVLSIIQKIYVVLLFVFFYAPVAVMIVFSFNTSKANVVWQGFTTRWYGELMSDSELWEIFGMTILIAILTTIFATLIGTMGAIGFKKEKRKWAKLITNSVYFPIIIPEIVLAVSLFMIFNTTGVALGVLAIVIGNTTICLPYVYITVKSRLVGMDPSIEEASLDLGADRIYTLFHITIPQILPGILSGAFMAFSLALDELIITSFLADAGTTTLPMKVYSSMKKGISPEINALTTIIFSVSAAGVIIYLVADVIKSHKKLFRRHHS